jgi:flagellar biosynthesis/type III secretory pathway protein FliH
VTAGQRLIEEGRQQGLEEGRQQGLEETRQRLQGMLLRLLRQRFGCQVTEVERRVAAASIEQVETWIGRVLLVASLNELFAN